MVAAMYLRKSRAEENEPIAKTLFRHNEILTEFALRQGITVAEKYEEVVSGDSLYGRPEMLRLLNNIASYDAVLCMDIDRLSRGTMHEQGLIFDVLKKHGVLIVTPVKTYDMTDDMDDSLIGFKALFAREEYKIIKNRLRKGAIRAVEEGCYLSNAPYGYKQARIDKKPTLLVEPREAEGIKLIFKLYLQGKGCQTIANTLHSLDFRPRRGNKFSRSTIGKILRNPTYMGKVVWNQFGFERQSANKRVKRKRPREEWLITDGLHEPIIDKKTFDEANRRLESRYQPPCNNKLMNPFAGVLYCKSCGRMMVRQPNSKRPLLLCETVNCMMGSSIDDTERLFFEGLKNMLPDLVVPPPSFERIGDNTALQAMAERRLSKLNRQRQRQYELLEQGIYDAETFRARSEELNRQSAETEALIEKLKDETIDREVTGALESVLDDYWLLDYEKRNMLIKAVIKRAVYSKPKGSGRGTLPQIEIVELR